MDIMELGASGELVGGVAVIGSLVYVGLQVRQNTRALVGTSREAMADRAIDWLMQLARDGESAEILRVGQADPSRLDANSTLRFQMMMYAIAESWEAAFSQWRRGVWISRPFSRLPTPISTPRARSTS